MNEIIVTALIAGVFGPALIAGVSAYFLQMSKRHDARIARAAKHEDWERQDRVAEAAAKAASDLLAETKRSTAISETAVVRIGEVHTLVNSAYTASMQERLDGLRREMVLLEGMPSTDTTKTAMGIAKARIEELEPAIAERLRVAALAESQAQGVTAIVEKLSAIDTTGSDTNKTGEDTNTRAQDLQDSVKRLEDLEQISEERITAVEEKTDDNESG